MLNLFTCLIILHAVSCLIYSFYIAGRMSSSQDDLDDDASSCSPSTGKRSLLLTSSTATDDEYNSDC